VIGWAMSEDMTTESTVIKAWYMAVGNRPIKNTLIFILIEALNMLAQNLETSLKATNLFNKA